MRWGQRKTSVGRHDPETWILLQRLAFVTTHLREGSALLSGGFEVCGDEFRLGLDVVTADVSNLLLPDHCHRLVACQRSSGRRKATEAKAGAGQPFHVPMVLFGTAQ